MKFCTTGTLLKETLHFIASFCTKLHYSKNPFRDSQVRYIELYQLNTKMTYIVRFFFTYIFSKNKTATMAMHGIFESSKQKIIQIIYRLF